MYVMLNIIMTECF